MTINLYPDQRELVDRIRSGFRSNKWQLMQACTGFGKTACIVDIVSGVSKKGNTAIINVPRIELLKQLSNTLRKNRIPHGIINSKHRPNPFMNIQISTTDTLAGRIDKIRPPSMFINDEAHVGGANLDLIVNKFKESGSYGLGASATPLRLDGRGLDLHYDHMECGPQMRWLIDNGRLNEYRVFAPESAVSSALAGGAEDFEIDKVMFGDAVEHYKTHAMGKRHLSFCRTIKHAEDTAEFFRSQGIPSAAIHGKLSDDEMMRRVKAFARREILSLSNCQIATFGWDLSQLTGMDATVEAASLLRLTDSLSLYMQIVGRILRVSDSPSFLFDHMGNVAKHGLPCSHREWSLDGRLKGSGERKEPTIPVRQCPIDGGGCGFVHRPSPSCPSCGFEYPIRDLSVEQVDATLVEINKSDMAVVAKKERQVQGQAQTLDELIELGKRKGYKNPRIWAMKVMQGRKQRGK